MKYNIILLLTIIVLIPSCDKHCEELTEHEYTLELEHNLYVEKFDDTVTYDNRFNSNNTIYKVCKTFVFSYIYEDQNGDRFFFEKEDNEVQFGQEEFTKWSMVPEQTPNKRTITHFANEIIPGLETFKEIDPDYNQTVFKFYDIQSNEKRRERGRTGLIENEMNVWMHPHRHGLFAMLEFAPFPFIQAPYEIGNTWNFDFINIGDEDWSDPRWLEFEGQLSIMSNYEITDIKTIKTAFGELECFEITGIATSSLAESTLVSYFNEKYGFVKLDYTITNGDKLFVDLVEVRE